MKTIIEEFDAVSESGQVHSIIVWQEWHDVGTASDPTAKVPGLKEMITSEGIHVNYIDPNTFKLVNTDEIIRRVG